MAGKSGHRRGDKRKRREKTERQQRDDKEKLQEGWIFINGEPRAVEYLPIVVHVDGKDYGVKVPCLKRDRPRFRISHR